MLIQHNLSSTASLFRQCRRQLLTVLFTMLMQPKHVFIMFFRTPFYYRL